ncbi:CLUMA_CG019772, isoform A [Clunio marinus]|uniref:CLUMA_CG019772, isoform A n=1 Tax=Clunio marinus TaxID=568069 RepID=A0A1J1J457_9DIPT|nr:CLUMA_CG019772, isoform A [Clunio marinus]
MLRRASNVQLITVKKLFLISEFKKYLKRERFSAWSCVNAEANLHEMKLKSTEHEYFNNS